MEYVRQDFKSGDVLSAEQLNHIEDGLVAVTEALNKSTGSKAYGIAEYKLAADKGVITDKIGIAVIEEDTDGQNT